MKNTKTPIIATGNWDELRRLVEEDEAPGGRGLITDADNMYELISEKIGREKEGGLYREGAAQENRWLAYPTGLMGIFTSLLGREEEAEEQHKLVGDTIGKGENKLYLRSVDDTWDRSSGPFHVGNSYEPTDVNAAMGILAFVIGEKDEADELYGQICDKIGRDKDGLYNHAISHSTIDHKKWTQDNALMGVLAHLLGKTKEAKKLYERVVKLPNGSASDDVTVGILAYVLGDEEAAKERYEAAKERYEWTEEWANGLAWRAREGVSGLYRTNPLGYEYTADNALMGIFKCILAGVEMKPSC